jgi:hypothetical protein
MADQKQKPRRDDIELVPDAWPRFERFIRSIVKADPQHRTKADKYSKVRKRKGTRTPAKTNTPK